MEYPTKEQIVTDTPAPKSTQDTAIVSSAHLAPATGDGWQLSELEYAMTMTFHAFQRWMTHCMKAVGYKDFNPLDILVLHHINHRAKEKRLSDVAFVLNIEDTHTVNYAIKKLVKADLIEGRKIGKEIFYSTTQTGQDVCIEYGKIRQACLLDAASANGRDFDEISHIARALRNISGLYDQASRAAASL